ncbi:MAG: UDP-3-O-(3-hydroxymyristoyl)glucosamine N-acyltransferase [Saprospiraceae bacterium]|nr:UDP-3-O-(3-hydroxymyristoyl)glucosamine N-acyltransferase [Saprospiraceae bacterium]
MTYSLAKIAELIGGTIHGDDQTIISGAAGLEDAVEGDISFVSSDKYLNVLESSSASAILIGKNLYKSDIKTPCLLVDNVYLALSNLLSIFSPDIHDVTEDKTMSFISPDCQIGEETKIGMFSIVESGTRIGNRTKVYGQVFIGENVKIGNDCLIYPGVKIYPGCEIGDNVILHANVIVGSDGFGFAPNANGEFKKIPQIGNVIIENDVEIGANTVIDRASMGSTIIRKGVKLDNLIQVAHNVEIGSHTVIAAQAGIAGSSSLGSYCQVGGQAGIVGHLQLADQTMIQAQSGMTKSVKKAGTKWYGSPAIEYNNYLKSFAIYKNLPDLQSRISKLEKLLEELQQQLK